MENKRRYASAQFGADNPAVGSETDLQSAVFGDVPEDLADVDPSDLLRSYALPEPELETTEGQQTGCGKPVGEVPQGIEVLVKKASIDPDFESRLMEDPLVAADEIELTLDPTERAMLQVVTTPQLRAIIKATVVPESHRRTFLGKTAAAMLVLLSTPDIALTMPPPTGGSRPYPDDFPTPVPVATAPPEPGTVEYTKFVVLEALQSEKNGPFGIPAAPFADPIYSEADKLKFRNAIASDPHLKVYISSAQMKRWRTVDDACHYIDRARMCQYPTVILVAKMAGVKPAGELCDKTLEGDLKLRENERAALRRALASTLKIYIPWETFRNLRTVDDIVIYVGQLALQAKKQREQAAVEPLMDGPRVPVQAGGHQPQMPIQRRPMCYGILSDDVDFEE